MSEAHYLDFLDSNVTFHLEVSGDKLYHLFNGSPREVISMAFHRNKWCHYEYIRVVTRSRSNKYLLYLIHHQMEDGMSQEETKLALSQAYPEIDINSLFITGAHESSGRASP